MPWESVFAVLPNPETLGNATTVDTSYSRPHQQDDRLTLLIVTTLVAVAMILFFIVLIRIWCSRKFFCLAACKNNRSQLSTASENIIRPAAHQQPQQAIEMVPATAVADKDVHSSSYTIKLIDNELIVETQESVTTCEDSPLRTSEEDTTPVLRDLVLKSWLLLTNKDWDTHSFVLETKSLCSSPVNASSSRRSETIQVSPEASPEPAGCSSGAAPSGFGLTQSSRSSHWSLNSSDRFSYTYGNQLEYMGGLYGYVDPTFINYAADNKSHPSSDPAEDVSSITIRPPLPGLKSDGHRKSPAASLPPPDEIARKNEPKRSYSIDLVGYCHPDGLWNQRKLSSV